MENQKFGANAKTTFLAKTGSVVGGMLAKQKCLTKVSCLQEKKKESKNGWYYQKQPQGAWLKKLHFLPALIEFESTNVCCLIIMPMYET